MKLPVMAAEHLSQLQAFEAKICATTPKSKHGSVRNGTNTVRRFMVRLTSVMPVTKFHPSI